MERIHKVRKQRVCFFAEAVTLAHMARPVVLAQALDPERYEVYLACDPRFTELFAETKVPIRRIRSIASEQFLKALAKGSPLYDVDTLHAYVKDDLAIIRETNPDLVVGDFRLSLAVSTRIAEKPYAAIANAYWSPYVRQRYPVPDLPITRFVGIHAAQAFFDLLRPIAFAYHALPLNRLQRAYGRVSVGLDLRRVYTDADYTLYVDIPELFPLLDPPPHHQYLGPIPWSAAAPLPEGWGALPQDRSVIYLTLGSSGRTDLLPILLDGLSTLPATVLVATAGRVTLKHRPANCLFAGYLPGAHVVARAHLAICNGGSPACQQALAAGVPVLGIPSNLDQLLNMDAIARYGAGMALRADRVTARIVRKTVARMLEDSSYGQAAARLAKAFSRYPAEERFRAFVADVLGAHAAGHGQYEAHPPQLQNG